MKEILKTFKQAKPFKFGCATREIKNGEYDPPTTISNGGLWFNNRWHPVESSYFYDLKNYHKNMMKLRQIFIALINKRPCPCVYCKESRKYGYEL